MKRVAPKYLTMMGSLVSVQNPSVAFFSTVTEEVISLGAELDAAYFVRNLVSPVKFSGTISRIIRRIEGAKTFLEIGPHSALAGPIRQILKAEHSVDEYMSVLSRGNNSYRDVLTTVGQLWLGRHELNMAKVVGKGKLLHDLPLYPWHYEESLSFESRLGREYRLRKHRHHELLGSRVLESTNEQPMWRNILRLEDVGWIKEHDVTGDIVLPGVAYLCMAGEAIRQLSSLVDFSCRQVHIKNAMVLLDGEEAEVITQLSRSRLTDSVDSDWYDFSISTHQKGTWIKHAFGEVRPGCEIQSTDAKEIGLEPLPRVCSHKAWYRKFRSLGFEYGSRFTGLKDITTHPVEPKLVASLTNDMRPGDEEYYSIHPVTLDCLPQGLAPAVFRGLARRFDRLSLPTYIEEFQLRPPPTMAQDMRCSIEITEERLTSYIGNVTLVSPSHDGHVVVHARGWTVTSISGTQDGDQAQNPHAAAELEWKEDIDFLDISKLIKPINAKDRAQVNQLLDRFSLLCMAETMHRLGPQPQPTREYLIKFYRWLSRFLEGFSGTEMVEYSGATDAQTLLGLGSEQRGRLMDAMYAELLQTEAHAAATAMHRIMTSCNGIFHATTDELGLILEGNVLHDLYDFMQNTEYSALLELLAHKKPNFRILEIGAGTGGTTITVLPVLQLTHGERMYSSYTYTDISSGFFPMAKERFKDFEAVEFAVLDISRNPLEQGFSPESFDLIIACNVLHATPSIDDTLANVRKLLHPRGHLFLQELAPTTKWINFIMGILPGWWLGEADGRFPEPYMDFERWQRALTKAGFGQATAVHDGYLNNNIICSTLRTIVGERVVTILRHENQDVDALEGALQEAGYKVNLTTLSDFQDHQPRDLIVALDLVSSFVSEMDQRQFHSLQSLAISQSNRGYGIFWITGPSQLNTTSPAYAPIHGLSRVLRSELQLDFATLELDNFKAAHEVVPIVFEAFHQRITEENVRTEMEWKHVNGKTFIARYHYINVFQELKSHADNRTVRKLEQHKPGLASTLYWKPIAPRVLRKGEVRVDVKATGLNFKVQRHFLSAKHVC